MNRLPTALGLALCPTTTCLLVALFTRSNIHTATPSEVAAVLPRILLQRQPADLAALERGRQFDDVIRQFNERWIPERYDPRIGYVASRTTTLSFRRDPKLGQLIQIIEKGPLEFDEAQKTGKAIGWQARAAHAISIERQIAASAITSEMTGDHTAAANFCMTGIKIADALMNSRGLDDYLLPTNCELEVIQATRLVALNPHFPSDKCPELLKTIKPSPMIDGALARAELTDFQQTYLKALPNPFKDYDDALNMEPCWPVSTFESTSYDSIETARSFGRLVMAALANSRRVYALCDFSEEQAAIKAGEGLPQFPPYDVPPGQRRTHLEAKYKEKATKMSNYFGRIMISSCRGEFGYGMMQSSMERRAGRDAVRVLLASRLFRAAHMGALPNSYKSLVPFLGAWPVDPYDGKPMRYSRRKQVVYAIGDNLVDDGGAIEGAPLSLDKGVSLALVALSATRH